MSCTLVFITDIPGGNSEDQHPFTVCKLLIFEILKCDLKKHKVSYPTSIVLQFQLYVSQCCVLCS